MDDMPANMVSKIVKYKKTFNELYNETGNVPKAYQIMTIMDISLKELNTIRAAAMSPVLLDAPINDEGNFINLDFIADTMADENNFNENLENEEIKIIIQEALEKLPDISRDIIAKRYFENKKLEEIAQARNVSATYIRQMIEKGFERANLLNSNSTI